MIGKMDEEFERLAAYGYTTERVKIGLDGTVSPEFTAEELIQGGFLPKGHPCYLYR